MCHKAVQHLKCDDGKSMCGKSKYDLAMTTVLADVTCVLCKLAYKENWKGRRPKG